MLFCIKYHIKDRVGFGPSIYIWAELSSYMYHFKLWDHLCLGRQLKVLAILDFMKSFRPDVHHTIFFFFFFFFLKYMHFSLPLLIF